MKKLSVICMAALLLLAASCKKEKKIELGDVMGFLATTEAHGGNSKTHLDGLKVIWDMDDEILVYSSNGGEYAAQKTFEATEVDGSTAVFSSGSAVEEAFFTAPYKAYYPASGIVDASKTDQITLPATQTYAANSFTPGANPMVAIAEDVELAFKNICGVLELSLQSTSACTVKNIAVTTLGSENLWGKGTVGLADPKNPTLSTLTDGGKTVTLDCSHETGGGVDISSEKVFRIVVPAGSLGSGFDVKLTASDGNVWNQTATGEQNVIERNKITVMPKLSVTCGPDVPDLLPGKFSVSPTEYVQFSRGNLYCTDKGSNNYEFSFEQNQYDFRNHPGKASMLNGVYSESSGTPDNTSGAFQWDVSAAAPGKDYGAFGTEYPGTPAEDATLDWGQAIGDNWYTMTDIELKYVVGFGSPDEKRPNYEYLRKISKIVFSGFEVNGLVLAPDSYDFTSNPLRGSYTESEWAQAEKEYGLVFFPCAGSGNNAAAAGGTGRYYLSKKPGDQLYFGSNGECYLGTSAGEYYCTSVRLVKKFDWPVKMPEFVDLDLPSGTLWANINIGAESPEKSGYFFAWGATKGYVPTGSTFSHDFNWANAPFNNGDASFNKPFFESVKETVCTAYSSGSNTYYKLVPEYDAAHIIYKDTWRMPARPDWDELLNNDYTIKEWTEDYNNTGVKGYIIKSKKDTSKSIFLPAAGYGNSTTLSELNRQCNYWTSTLHSGLHCAYEFIMKKSGGGVTHDDNNRCQGCPIRAVK